MKGEQLRHFRHELRTPVSHIVGFAEILVEEDPLPALRDISSAARELLDALQTALPGDMQSLNRVQLEQAAAALRPRIAHITALCHAITAEGDSLDHLRTIAGALEQLAAILEKGVRGFA